MIVAKTAPSLPIKGIIRINRMTEKIEPMIVAVL